MKEQATGQGRTLKGSMRIIRALPDAPKPTRPTKVITAQEAREAERWVRVAEHQKAENRRHGVWTKDQEMKLIRLWNENQSTKVICREMGIEYKRLMNKIYWLQSIGRIEPRRRNFTVEQVETMRGLHDGGMSYPKIAKMFNTSAYSVGRALRREPWLRK